MIGNYFHEKDPVKNFMAVIKNEDAIKMYTLLDLDNKERRCEYIEFSNKINKKTINQKDFTEIKKLIGESHERDKYYMSVEPNNIRKINIIDKKNIFSLFNGVDKQELIRTKDDMNEPLCQKELIDFVFGSGVIKEKKDGKVVASSPHVANTYRLNIFRCISDGITDSTANRDCFSWPISVSDTLGFNESSEKDVHAFGVASYFFRESFFSKMTELDERYARVAEHDALIRLSRLTGLNIIIVDVDAVISSMAHYKKNEILSVIVKEIFDNNNSLIFFKKSSVFYENSSREIVENILELVRNLYLQDREKGGNYIIISNVSYSFYGSFRYSFGDSFDINNNLFNGLFDRSGGVSDYEMSEREWQMTGELKDCIIEPESIVEKLDDIIGLNEAREVIGDIILFYKKPELAKKLGVNLSSGILLTGEPGTGKTAVSRAMAKELGRKVLMVTGSDFTTHHYGDAISKVKILFSLAREIKPCIIFIDEIEGIGNRNNDRMHPEERRIVNKFLSEMSEKSLNDGIVFIGATNNQKEMDPAMLRDGRFDKKIVVGMPSMEDRKKAFMMFLGRRPVNDFDSIDFDYLAMKTAGMTVATIENIVNQSAIIALRKESEFINEKMVEQAILDNIAGGEMSKRVMKPELLKRIAYHEAGHAIIGYHLDVGDIGGVSIIPRANALGMVFFDVDDDRLALSTEDDLSNQMMVALAGRASEEVFLGNISTGAAGDLEACTKIALSMIQNYGMGDSMVYSYKRGGFNGDIPTEIRGKVDNLIKEKYKEVLRIIKKNKPAIKAVAEELIAREVISGKDFIRIIRGE